MDSAGDLATESKGPFVEVQVQPQIRTAKSTSVTKSKLKSKQAIDKDEAKKSTDDEKYSLTILPSKKTHKDAIVGMPSSGDVQLQERLDLKLKHDLVVNGDSNGLDLDLDPKMISNGSSNSSSHCCNSDICNGSVIDHQNRVTTEMSTERSSQLNDVEYVSYLSELQMPDIMRLIQKDLSEPYSIYTYRYFIHNWPRLCFLAMDGNECVGAIVCKLDVHRKVVKRGYIAMLAVDEKYRKRKIGSHLVLKAIRAMVADDADEVVLETEITNRPALRLYENLGFVRDKRLFRYYLNGVDALRLKLWLR